MTHYTDTQSSICSTEAPHYARKGYSLSSAPGVPVTRPPLRKTERTCHVDKYKVNQIPFSFLVIFSFFILGRAVDLTMWLNCQLSSAR